MILMTEILFFLIVFTYMSIPYGKTLSQPLKTMGTIRFTYSHAHVLGGGG
jgi:hypothetical protein